MGLKKKIQELVFPEGVLIDTKKRQYLTKKVNSVFVVNSLLSSNCNHKKENDSSGKLESSYLVARNNQISNHQLIEDLIKVKEFHDYYFSEIKKLNKINSHFR